jgi:hypothetical protein
MYCFNSALLNEFFDGWARMARIFIGLLGKLWLYIFGKFYGFWFLVFIMREFLNWGNL